MTTGEETDGHQPSSKMLNGHLWVSWSPWFYTVIRIMARIGNVIPNFDDLGLHLAIISIAIINWGYYKEALWR